MFGANAVRNQLTYRSMQELLLAHVWLAFLLCYLWLRGKRLDQVACLLGAGVFAFSGYLCLQLQHFGLVAAYTWMPLGCIGVDQAVESGSWKPLWNLALASAFAFLGGYPPSWFVFAVRVGVYALFGKRPAWATAGVIAALILSLGLVAVQLLPA